MHTDAHICRILRTRGGSKSLPSVSVISDFLHTALGTGCKQNLRKRRSPPAQSVGLHTQSPPNRTVTTEKDTYDQSNMLTEAWCRGTPTTGFQTQDPKPSLQKWGNFRHLEPTVRHPKESRHQGSRFMMGGRRSHPNVQTIRRTQELAPTLVPGTPKQFQESCVGVWTKRDLPAHMRS